MLTGDFVKLKTILEIDCPFSVLLADGSKKVIGWHGCGWLWFRTISADCFNAAWMSHQTYCILFENKFLKTLFEVPDRQVGLS
jgi:hypothetical protein